MRQPIRPSSGLSTPSSLGPDPSKYTRSQIEETRIVYRGQLLKSDSEKSPRTRHRFGFSGLHKRPERPQNATPDEILDSLTRQAGSQTELGEAQTQRLELLIEPEETRQFLESEELSSEPVPGKRSLGHFAFALMMLIGMAGVWFYSRGSRFYDPATLTGLVQATGVQRVFANPVEVGVVFFMASILALWVAHRRRSSSLNILES
jgi:hypothetical protein